MKKVIVYTKNSCPYCDSAKRLLKQLSIPFEEENLEHNPEKRQTLSQKANGYRTMPMIWVGDTFVGGFSDLDALNKSGGLMTMIKA